ncbi:helix-turn-helix domain-containing protein [Tsukamurella sp. 8F]|uniref:AraC family transcriptional regulator n=1 Tax=unclassified Tsukamurella TaxID=2633480 RepID=UPI0023B93977|nr:MULTISPECIES: helix-turn-helix domain-containing protein [unclassified Tsukamurella]MDF0532212.1 helix-turn-helix domain-containing protein [Tsukamurella sp. 8J]MDF0588083.1 helix-turn-helix domain-containing protein [Tsukamurella sp. 8F]
MGSWTNPPPAAGILRPENAGALFELRTAPPPARLGRYVDLFWSVHWSLRAPQQQPSQVISYPVVHVTAETGPDRYGHEMPAELVHGVVTRRFDITLSESGYCYGIRFSPGGFTAITGRPAHPLTDRVERLDAPELAAVHEDPSPGAALEHLVAAVDSLHTTDDDGPLDMVATLERDIRENAVTTVADAAARHGLSERTVQRLLRTHVGVGARWMIRRCRLHDALTELHENGDVRLADLAVRLGWYDQAHFTRDFTTAVGISPHAYVARDPSHR